jgi:hypothetical protein
MENTTLYSRHPRSQAKRNLENFLVQRNFANSLLSISLHVQVGHNSEKLMIDPDGGNVVRSGNVALILNQCILFEYPIDVQACLLCCGLVCSVRVQVRSCIKTKEVRVSVLWI